jgi:photosystem II stability/assembly factor-like uncharacterized protein
MNLERLRLVRLFAGILSAALATRAAAQETGAWISIGPTDVGMVTAIAGGRSAVYAATCDGVYRSDDGAGSWQLIGLQHQCVVRLAVDPHAEADADTLYAVVDNRAFVGLYPEPSYMALSGLVLGSTLWVSTDGGGTWVDREVDSGHALAVDLTQPGTAYVGNYGTYYPLAVTHDSGTTWRTVPDAPGEIFLSLAVDPRDGTLYAASSYLSTLSGGSWNNLAIHVTVVATGTGADGAVYAAGDQNFCRRTSTANWTCNATSVNTPLSILEVPAQPQGAGPRILLLTFDGIQSSDDGGATFSPLSGGPEGYTPVAALDPSGAAVYAGNDVGVYRSADRGASWTNSSAGLSSTWVRALAVDPSHPSTIYAGVEGRVYDLGPVGPGLFRSTDGGDSWNSVSVAGQPGYVFSLGIDPSNSQNLFTASVSRADRSADGGASWTEMTFFQSSDFIHALAVDPSSSSKVWAATNHLEASTDGGETWSRALPDQVFSILFDTRHPGTIYAGEYWQDAGFYYPYGSGFAVQTSRDGGATWKRVGNASGAAVVSFAADPFSDGVVYACTYSGSILRSPDSGATWAQWNTDDPASGGPIWALVADPARNGALYLGTWLGAYQSVDGGKTWALFSDGLGSHGVLGLAVSPDGRFLYAGTTGGGVFRRDLRLYRAPVVQVGGSGARTTRSPTRP